MSAAIVLSALLANQAPTPIDPDMLVYPTPSGYWDFNDPGEPGSNEPETQWQRQQTKPTTTAPEIDTAKSR